MLLFDWLVQFELSIQFQNITEFCLPNFLLGGCCGVCWVYLWFKRM